LVGKIIHWLHPPVALPARSLAGPSPARDTLRPYVPPPCLTRAPIPNPKKQLPPPPLIAIRPLSSPSTSALRRHTTTSLAPSLTHGRRDLVISLSSPLAPSPHSLIDAVAAQPLHIAAAARSMPHLWIDTAIGSMPFRAATSRC
jgi:hypothetical protein